MTQPAAAGQMGAVVVLATQPGAPTPGTPIQTLHPATTATPLPAQAARQAARASKDVGAAKKSELEMWREWKDSGHHPAKLEPLLQSLNPLMQKRVNDFAGRVPIPRVVLEAQARNIVISALRGYNPDKAQMNTHLTNNLRALRRKVIQNQNVSRITEERAARIGDYHRAVAQLNNELGEPPTPQQIAERMGMPIKKLTLLQQELRADLLASASPVEDPFVIDVPKSNMVLAQLPADYPPGSDERKILDYLLGINGKKKTTSTGAIAKSLGWADSKVSVLRKKIAQKAMVYLQQLE